MTLFLIVTLNGLTLAALYFLAASGFSLIFGLMRTVNMAHGALLLLGGPTTADMDARRMRRLAPCSNEDDDSVPLFGSADALITLWGDKEGADDPTPVDG